MNFYFVKCKESNFTICVQRGLWGNEKGKLNGWKSEDKLFLYTGNKISGVFEITSEQFVSYAHVWPDKIYPFRVKIEPIKILNPNHRISLDECDIKDEISNFYGKQWAWKLTILLTPLKESIGERIEEMIYELPEDSLFPNIENEIINLKQRLNPEGRSMSNAKIDKNLVWRCYFLGIVDLYEIAIFSALSVRENMIGNTDNIIREAVALIDPAGKQTTSAQMEETAKNLLSKGLLKKIERPNTYLYLVNPDFWNRNMSEIRLELLEIYKLFHEYNCMPFNLDVFVRQIKKNLANKYDIQAPEESTYLHLIALSKKNVSESVRLITYDDNHTTRHKVAWNGTCEILALKIEKLSKTFSALSEDLGDHLVQTLKNEKSGHPEDEFESTSEQEDDLEQYATDFSEVEGGEIEDDKRDETVMGALDKQLESTSKFPEESGEKSERIPDGDLTDLLDEDEIEDDNSGFNLHEEDERGDIMDSFEQESCPECGERLFVNLLQRDGYEYLIKCGNPNCQFIAFKKWETVHFSESFYEEISKNYRDIINWEREEFGVIYKVLITKDPRKYQKVYIIEKDQTKDRKLEILSLISRVKNKDDAYVLLKEVDSSCSCRACVTQFMGHDYYAVMCGLPFEVNQDQVVSGIREAARIANNIKKNLIDK